MTKTRFTKPIGDNLLFPVGFKKKNRRDKMVKKIKKMAKRNQILWWLQEQEGAVVVRCVNKVIP